MLLLTIAFIAALCATLLSAYLAGWFFWPRLMHLRATQDPQVKAKIEYELLTQAATIEAMQIRNERSRTEVDMLRLRTISKDEAIFDATQRLLHQNLISGATTQMLQLPEPMTQQIDPVATLIAALHLMIIGFSDGGKTTLMHHLASLWARMQRVMVLDFDYANGMWDGCEVFTESGVEEFCNKLTAEFEARQLLRQSGARTKFDPWRIIIDEYSAVSSNKQVTSIIELLIRRGRKYSLCVVVGIQDKQVRSLGWEGKGELRSNFTFTVEAKVNSNTRQRTLTLKPNEGEVITCLTPHLPDPERSIKPVQTQDNGQPIDNTGTTTNIVPLATADNIMLDLGLSINDQIYYYLRQSVLSGKSLESVGRNTIKEKFNLTMGNAELSEIIKAAKQRVMKDQQKS